MTKSEKNVLADVVGMLNALVTGNSDGNQVNQPANEEAAPADNEPSQEEIEFVKSLKADGEIAIKGISFNYDTKELGKLQISSNCLSHLLDAYLEKYDHE